MDKKQQFSIWYAVAALAAVLLFQGWWTTYKTVEPLAYSEFMDRLKKGEITEVVIDQTTVQGRLKTPQNGRDYFVTTRVDPAFAKELEQYGVRYSGRVTSTFFSDLLSWIIPVLFFFGLYYFFFRRVIEKQGLGGMMSV